MGFRWIALMVGVLFQLEAIAQTKALPENPKELSFLDTTANILQAHQASLMAGIVEVIDQKNNPLINILHIGDEQVSTLSETFRKQLMGSTTGLGLFFPSSLNNYALDCEVNNSHTGLWTYATAIENNRLLPVGLSGYSAKTEDWKSSLSITIPQAYQKIVDRFTVICDRSEYNFDVVVTCMGAKKANGTASVLSKKEFPSSVSYRNAPSLELLLPPGTQEILVQFKQVISAQKSFVLHGISLTNSRSANLHSIGMRGCGYNELIRLELLKQQLTLLSPDLVLLDFGIHDNYRGDEQQDAYLEPLKRSIKIVRDAIPSAKIIVVIPQDCVRGGRTLKTFEKFEQAIITMCKTDRVAYYDWYRVAGGKHSAQYWSDYQLFMPDGLHLEELGTLLKSSCYASAFSAAQSRYQNGYRQFVLADDTSRRLAYRTRDTMSKNIVVSEVWRYHVVRRGETAYRIALRYGITVAQLKEWNHLRNYNIAAGTRLKVGKLSIATKSDPIQSIESKESAEAETQDVKNNSQDSSGTQTNTDGGITRINPNKGKPETPIITPNTHSVEVSVPSETVKPKETSKPVKPKPVYHRVKTGETLYSISKAYGLTVDQLKRLNGLSSNSIGVGRVLRVR